MGVDQICTAVGFMQGASEDIIEFFWIAVGNWLSDFGDVGFESVQFCGQVILDDRYVFTGV